MPKPRLDFLKLGGSIITDKENPLTLRERSIERLAGEIGARRSKSPETYLVIGNGAGSFGHYLAKKLARDSDGSYSRRDAAEIHAAVEKLNSAVVKALRAHEVNAFGIPGTSFAKYKGEDVLITDTAQFESLFSKGAVPCIYGDMLPGSDGKWYVASTEKLFLALSDSLSEQFSLDKCLFATNVDGVLDKKGALTDVISQAGGQTIADHGNKAVIDVTGGMKGKLESAFGLAKIFKEIWIINGKSKGSLYSALRGKPHGTRVLL